MPTLADFQAKKSFKPIGSSSYSPSFGVGKNFKTIADLGDAGGMFKAGYQSYLTPDYIKRMAGERPDLFTGISDPSSLVTANMVEGESGQQQQGWNFDPQLQDILSQFSLQRRGASGMEDGRTNALVGADGNIGYADTPYSYDPAGDTTKSLMEAAALAAAAFGGVGAAGGGPFAGMFGAGSPMVNGAFLGEAPWAATGGGSLFGGAEAAALGAGGAGAGAGGGLATMGGLPPFTPIAAETLAAPGLAEAIPGFTGASGASSGSAVDKILGALKTGGGNILDKAMADPLKALSIAGGVGAVLNKPKGAPSFDPAKAAAAQGDANKDASWYDAVLNRPDMQTPWGSSTWTLKPGADPKNPKPGDWVNNVALDPAQQGLLEGQNALSKGYNDTALGMLGRVQAGYDKPFDISGIPGMPDFASINTDADRKRVEEALLGRLEPQLARDEESLRSRLVNTGFEAGSAGTEIEMDRFNRQKNDSRLAAIIQAGTEARGQSAEQRANMQAQQQARQQGFTEQSLLRDRPLNELNALRTGSQVQAPSFQSIIPTNTAASPEMDALLAKLGIDKSNAANSQAGYNAILQALAGLGGAWIGGRP